MFISHILFPLLSSLLLLASPPIDPVYELTVEAGKVDRLQSVVSFTLPDDLSPGPLYLQNVVGKQYPVQRVNDDGWFILEDLKAGQKATYSLYEGEPATTSGANGVIAEATAGDVAFKQDSTVIFTYNNAKTILPRNNIDQIYRRGGYIHPVHTPSGILVTNDYPSNHVHHHGIWASWTNTRFQGRKPDFWNMGNGTGTVEPVNMDTTWQGPVMGGVVGRHRYVDLSADEPVDVLNETWETRVFAVQDEDTPYHLFELRVTQTTASDNFLTLPKYRYGGVGFRGHDAWEGVKNTYFLTSEGKGRLEGHGTRARWCHIGGFVDGAFAGVAILSHPDNFRAPQPMRIHPSEPFFNWAPSQAGDWTIRPGKPYEAAYRFVVMDGEPDKALIDRLWDDWAKPAKVKVKKVG
ncbi:MAG: PmoA family protein [Bacteroidota bacterium]